MGPGATRFDIAAKIPKGAAADKVPEMVQALLADRFGLTVHRGTTVQPIYALVVAKGGLKLERAGAAAAPRPGCAWNNWLRRRNHRRYNSERGYGQGETNTDE